MKLKIDNSSYFYIFWSILTILIIFFIQSKSYFSFEIIILLIFLLILNFVFIKNKLVFVVILATILVNFRVSNYVKQLYFFDQINEQKIAVCGQLSDNSNYKNGATNYKISRLKINNRNLKGKIIIKKPGKKPLIRSNQICASGQFEILNGGYVGIVKQAKITKIIPKIDIFTKIRQKLAQRFVDLSVRSRNFANAILLGDRNLINGQQNNTIRKVGLSHVIVVSGLHLMIIVNLIRKSKLINSRNFEFWTIIILALIFAAVTGFSASMVRASMMLFVGLVAWYFGRHFEPINLFILILAISLLINPFYALFDVSWLLSYGALWAVFVISPQIKQFLGLEKLNPVFDLMLTVALIQIVLAPLLIYFFGALSVVSILANLLIVPVITILMFLLILLLIFSGFLLDKILVPMIEIIFEYIFGVIDFFVKIPFAQTELSLNLETILVIYLVFHLAMIYVFYKNKLEKPTLSSIMEADEETN